jgi:serine/threonine protein kinase
MAKTYGRWDVVRSLSAGGQAETFVVRDRETGDDGYVLKRLRNPQRQPRFKVEVETLRALDHPNVVRLVDAKLAGATAYLVMEYCAGGSLDAHEGRWRDDPVAALDLVAQVCDGVGAAHAKGVTHRDIKPPNVLLRSQNGPPVVADFGIAFVVDGERQTLTDEAVGARRYTAPELEDGRVDLVGPRSDVYSLGKLLYWLLAGRVFDREKHRERAWDLARREGHGAPELEHVNRVLDRMIAHNPRDRYEDASAAGRAVREAANLLRRGARALAPDLPQGCAFWRLGEYKTIPLRDAFDIGNFGLRPISGNEWKALVCGHCGNVQLFRIDLMTTRAWWGKG